MLGVHATWHILAWSGWLVAFVCPDQIHFNYKTYIDYFFIKKWLHLGHINNVKTSYCKINTNVLIIDRFMYLMYGVIVIRCKHVIERDAILIASVCLIYRIISDAIALTVGSTTGESKTETFRATLGSPWTRLEISDYANLVIDFDLCSFIDITATAMQSIVYVFTTTNTLYLVDVYAMSWIASSWPNVDSYTPSRKQMPCPMQKILVTLSYPPGRGQNRC